jgi:Flp pilus assembly protein TadD
MPMQKKNILFLSYVVMAGVIISLIVTTHLRNRVFKTPVTLWADAASKSVNKRRTHENYGQALSTAGMYIPAINELKTVLALRDDGSVPPRDTYREIGVVYFRVGMIDDAVVSWKTGLRYAPGDPGLLNNLSVALMKQGRYDEAETAVRQALLADPNMPHLLNTMGEILMRKGDYRAALKYFLAAIANGPDDPARYWNAAVAYERTGQYDMAYSFARQCAARSTSRATYERAVGYMQELQNRYLSKGTH